MVAPQHGFYGRGEQLLHVTVQPECDPGVVVVFSATPVDDDVGSPALDCSEGYAGGGVDRQG